jgi:hypothetical protein
MSTSSRPGRNNASKDLIDQGRSMRFVRCLLWTSVVPLAVVQAVHLAERISYPSWIPYNGYFQNANPVERMCAGQWPGRDFDPYLGLATPWLAWPAAALTTCDPQTIDLIYNLLTHGLLLLLLGAIGWALGLRGRVSVVLFALACLVQTALGGLFPYLNVRTGMLYSPAVSLFGIRVAVPLLLVLAVAAILPRLQGRMRPLGWGTAGAAAGAAALLAPDSGATALLGLAAALLAWELLGGAFRPVRLLAGAAVAAVSCAAVLGIGAYALTGGKPAAWIFWLLYKMLPTQGWLFSYDPQAVATSWTAPLTHPPTILLLSLAALLWRTGSVHREAVTGVVAAALSAGWIPYLGGMQNERYLEAIEIVLVAFATAGAVLLLATARPAIRQWSAVGALLVFLANSLLMLPSALGLYRAPTIPDPWGGNSHTSWERLWTLGERIRTEGGTLVSLYYGPLDRAAGNPPARRQDYIIHAFGSDDVEAWRLAVAQAGWISTLSPDAISFGRWLERVFWPVLRTTYLVHAPVEDMATLRIWKAREIPLRPDGADVACTISADGTIRLSSEGLNEPFLAEISFSIPPGGEPIAVERSSVIPERTPAGSYALNPSLGHHTLPVDLVPGEETTLRIYDKRRLVLPRDCSASLFLPRSRLSPPAGPIPEGPQIVREWPLRLPDGGTSWQINLRPENPSDRIPLPGEALAACPDNPIRHVQWIRENLVTVVLRDSESRRCFSDLKVHRTTLLPRPQT